jgi:hypothetical protein
MDNDRTDIEDATETFFYDSPLEDRIAAGIITRMELQERARSFYSETESDLPLFNGIEYGCPICYSLLSIESRLVRESGYVVCDYCVNFVEDYV